MCDISGKFLKFILKIGGTPYEGNENAEGYGIMKKRSVESGKKMVWKRKKKPPLTEEEVQEKMLRERRKGFSIAIGLGTAFVAILVFFLIVDTDTIMFI